MVWKEGALTQPRRQDRGVGEPLLSCCTGSRERPSLPACLRPPHAPRTAETRGGKPLGPRQQGHRSAAHPLQGSGASAMAGSSTRGHGMGNERSGAGERSRSEGRVPLGGFHRLAQVQHPGRTGMRCRLARRRCAAHTQRADTRSRFIRCSLPSRTHDTAAAAGARPWAASAWKARPQRAAGAFAAPDAASGHGAAADDPLPFPTAGRVRRNGRCWARTCSCMAPCPSPPSAPLFGCAAAALRLGGSFAAQTDPPCLSVSSRTTAAAGLQRCMQVQRRGVRSGRRRARGMMRSFDGRR
jgi:hypothetical protein